MIVFLAVSISRYVSELQSYRACYKNARAPSNSMGTETAAFNANAQANCQQRYLGSADHRRVARIILAFEVAIGIVVVWCVVSVIGLISGALACRPEIRAVMQTHPGLGLGDVIVGQPLTGRVVWAHAAVFPLGPATAHAVFADSTAAPIAIATEVTEVRPYHEEI